MTNRKYISRATGLVAVVGIGLIALLGYGDDGEGCDNGPSVTVYQGLDTDRSVGYLLRKNSEGRYQCVFQCTGVLVGWNLVATSKYCFSVVAKLDGSRPMEGDWAFGVTAGDSKRICNTEAAENHANKQGRPQYILGDTAPDSLDTRNRQYVKTVQIRNKSHDVYKFDDSIKGLYRIKKFMVSDASWIVFMDT